MTAIQHRVAQDRYGHGENYTPAVRFLLLPPKLHHLTYVGVAFPRGFNSLQATFDAGRLQVDYDQVLLGRRTLNSRAITPGTRANKSTHKTTHSPNVFRVRGGEGSVQCYAVIPNRLIKTREPTRASGHIPTERGVDSVGNQLEQGVSRRADKSRQKLQFHSHSH